MTPIAKSQDALPEATYTPATAPGRMPDADPWLARAVLAQVVKIWDRDRAAHQSLHPDVRMKLHMAGKCSRQLTYQLTGVDKSDPRVSDLGSRWPLILGDIVHDYAQGAATELFPDAQVEVSIDGRPVLGAEVSGRGDMGLPAAEVPGIGTKRVFVEIKSRNGFGFKADATTFRGPPEGPNRGGVLQGAMGALAWDADLFVLLEISLEAVAIGEVTGIVAPDENNTARVAAQWTFTREEFEPMALAEAKRLAAILAAIDAAQARGLEDDPVPMPRRQPIDDGTVVTIVNPKSTRGKGAWELHDADGLVVATGLDWHCQYCEWRTRCIGDGPAWSPDPAPNKETP